MTIINWKKNHSMNECLKKNTKEKQGSLTKQSTARGNYEEWYLLG